MMPIVLVWGSSTAGACANEFVSAEIAWRHQVLTAGAGAAAIAAVLLALASALVVWRRTVRSSPVP